MATAWLNNPNRDNDAWRSLYELCVKYHIDPDDAFSKSYEPTLSIVLAVVRSRSLKMSTSKVKAGTLWGKSKEDLLKQLGELKTDLGQLRIQKINSSGAKLNRMYVSRSTLDIGHDIRKSIARVLTVINLKQRSQLRLFYKNKKYLPLDLRAKQTRAIRRRLSPAEAGKVLEKTKKRSTHFPQRKYAVKVR
ncbi:putative Ribosomal L29 protein-domain-containing protein [Seiridium unicorne]|uniref:Ribosomal L29 protein-domain-containing protein n=1 Tax=Seiridium unicorne TaxID=138068 RepID=A0ABR2UV12_9PEZI